MVDYSVNLPQLQQAQAPNMLSMAEHLQKMQTSNMLMQQRAREVQKENALTEILGRSGGKATPDVIKGLIASGNYEPALALQRHAATMGSIGVNTQAAQTALEEARLRMGETKRTLQVGAAARDYISGNDDLTNPDALKKLRQTNPDAFEAITKFNGLNAKMTYEASTAKRLDDKAKLDLLQGTASLFAPAFATAQTPDQYTKLWDQLAKVYPDLPAIASRDFTQDNVKNIVQTGANAQDLMHITVSGRPGILNRRTNQIQWSETGAPGDNAAMPTQTAAVTPPAAAGTSPMASTGANSLAAAVQPGVAPNAPNVNNLAPAVQPDAAAVAPAVAPVVAPVVAPAVAPAPAPAPRPAQRTVEQILAAEQEAKPQQVQREAEARAQGTADVARMEETKKIALAKEKLAPTLTSMITAYKNLAQRGELISAEGDQSLMQRAKIGTLAALPSKVSTVLSPKTGSDLTTIENLRRDLFPTIIEMTGAKSGDAVKEMESILGSLTSPGQSDATIVATLNNFSKKYGLGELMSLEDLKPAGKTLQSDTAGATQRVGGTASSQSAKPTLDQFLTRVKPLNPNASMEDLTAYYNRTYGGR
jgi:hypothetical protein